MTEIKRVTFGYLDEDGDVESWEKSKLELVRIRGETLYIEYEMYKLEKASGLYYDDSREYVVKVSDITKEEKDAIYKEYNTLDSLRLSIGCATLRIDNVHKIQLEKLEKIKRSVSEGFDEIGHFIRLNENVTVMFEHQRTSLEINDETIEIKDTAKLLQELNAISYDLRNSIKKINSVGK